MKTNNMPSVYVCVMTEGGTLALQLSVRIWTGVKVAVSDFTVILRQDLAPLTSFCFLFALIRPRGLIG